MRLRELHGTIIHDSLVILAEIRHEDSVLKLLGHPGILEGHCLQSSGVAHRDSDCLLGYELLIRKTLQREGLQLAVLAVQTGGAVRNAEESLEIVAGVALVLVLRDSVRDVRDRGETVQDNREGWTQHLLR